MWCQDGPKKKRFFLLTHLIFSVHNTLGHFQEDREEGGLEDPHLGQSSKQAAEYEVNVCFSRLSKDLFCNKQVAEKSLQRRDTCGREETKL